MSKNKKKTLQGMTIVEYGSDCDIKGQMTAAAAIVVALYIILSAIAILAGLLSSGQYESYAVKDCYKTPTRAGQLFPAYRFGCYLGSPVTQDYYDYDSKKDLEKGKSCEQ